MDETQVVTGTSVGARVRALRRASGLSQSELAGGRFSKEYVSQVERGKTRPTAATLEWFAARLGTDRDYLEQGLTADDRERVEEILARGRQLADEYRYDEAAAEFRRAREALSDTSLAALLFAALRGEAWADIRRGQVGAARDVLAAAEPADFADAERAELVFLDGVCAYSESDVSGALERFAQALRETEGGDDRLRSEILQWRSRAYRRVRDFEAAREDIELALELADARSDPRAAADALFQAALVAQREGRWVLARRRMEEARALLAELGDQANVARAINNMAGLTHLLGDADSAIAELRAALAIFVELDLRVDAGYVMSSLAEITLDRDAVEAEELARKALVLLDNRVDHLQEIGTAHLALGRSLLAQGRPGQAEAQLDAADAVFARAASESHQADALIARGDLLRSTGDERAAAGHYRRAATTLLSGQD